MRKLWLIVVFVFIAQGMFAQVIPPGVTAIGAGSSSATDCVTNSNCAAWSVPNTAPSFTAQLTGTMTSMTVTFEGTADGQTWFSVLAVKLSTGAIASTTTATGQYAIVNTGLVGLRARCTTYASGGINISLTRGPATSAVKLAPIFPATFTAGDLVYASGANTLAGINDVAVGQVLTSGGVGVVPAYTASPSITGTYTTTLTALGTTSTDGIIAANGTAALVGTPVQISPRIRLTGNGWDTDDVVSRPVRFFEEALPTGTTTVAGTWKLGYMDPITNGLTYPLTVTSAGALTTLSSVTTNSTVVGNYLRANGNGVLLTAGATLASGFSTTTPTVAGVSSAFNITIAATPGVTGTVNFGTTFNSVPSCSCTNTITANAVQCVPTTTQAVLNGVWIANDIIRCIAIGY